MDDYNKDAIYSVYLHIFPNDKKYVGITSKKPLHRWGSHGQGYKRQSLIWNAICKYGWDNIQHIILYTNKTEEEAFQIEQDLIQLFNTKNPNGYNIDDGGKGSSNEIRRRVKENHADVNGGNHPRSISVYCIELNKFYACMRDAQRELGINTKDIGNCCKGIRNTAGDYHWIYTNELANCNMDEILKRKKHAQITNKKRVRCIESNKIYDSITQASKETGFDLSSISACCRGKLKTTHGFHWEFLGGTDTAAH